MSENKQVRFSFVVDENSARSVHRVLDELIKKANELGKALGGAGGGGILGGVRTGAGTPSSQGMLAGKGGAVASKQGGGGFAQVLTSNVDVFKKVAQDGGAAMRVMGDAVKRSVIEQEQGINKLKGTLANLIREYDRVGGATSGAIGKRAQLFIANKLVEIDEATKQLNKLKQAAPPEPDQWRPWHEEPAEKGGIGSRLKGMVGKSSIGQMLQGLGLTPGMMGGAALGMVGAWGIKGIQHELQNRPNQYLEAEAKWGQTYSQRSMDIRSGDFRNIMAERNIMRDSEKRQDYADLGGGWRRFGHNLSAIASFDFAGGFSGRAGEMGVRKARQEQVRMEREANPLEDAIKGEAQNYRATMGTMRAMGIGVRHKGDSGFQRLSEYRKGYSSFDDSEIAAAFQGLSGAGTRRAAYGLQGGVMQATAAGIQGAAQSVGTMSKFGPYAGGQFSNALRELAGVGAGGADASTAGIIGQFVASQSNAFGINTSRPGGFQGQGLMDMLSTGTAGGNRLAAEQNIRGAEYLQRSMTGQTSPYQAARNYMVAREAAPELGMYGQSFLSKKMSLTEIADAAKGVGGGVSDVFSSLGGTKAQAAAYFKGYTKTLMEGAVQKGFGEDTLAGKMAKSLSESGGLDTDYFEKKKWKGVFKNETEARKGLVGALQAGDANMDPATAEGLATILSGVGRKPVKGRMAGDVAGGSQETDVAREHLNAVAMQNNTGALNELTDAVKNLTLRTKMEQEGINFHGMSDEKRRLYDQAMGEMKPGGSKADLENIVQELEWAEEWNKGGTHSKILAEMSRRYGKVSREVMKKRGFR